MEPAAVESLQKTLKELYGLEGTLIEQYLAFWKHLFTFDLGPSLSMFPTPVMEIIATSLPWTFFFTFIFDANILDSREHSRGLSGIF